jgi:hypothetical protein
MGLIVRLVVHVTLSRGSRHNFSMPALPCLSAADLSKLIARPKSKFDALP